MMGGAGYSGTRDVVGKIVDAMNAKNYDVPTWVLGTYSNAPDSASQTKIRISTSDPDELKETVDGVTVDDSVDGDAQATKGTYILAKLTRKNPNWKDR